MSIKYMDKGKKVWGKKLMPDTYQIINQASKDFRFYIKY